MMKSQRTAPVNLCSEHHAVCLRVALIGPAYEVHYLVQLARERRAVTHTREHLQGCQGGKAGGLVASEFAAMLDTKMMPDMLAKVAAANGGFHSQQYTAYTKAFAARINKPFYQVNYPMHASLDNCKAYPFGRALMVKPRVTEAQKQEHQQWLRAKIDAIGISEALQARAEAAAMIESKEGPAAVHSYKRALDDYAGRVKNVVLKARRAQCKQEHDCSLEQFFTWDRAQDIPWMRVLWPEQMMWLVECTPDMHCTVEHQVRVLKCFLRGKLYAALKQNEPLQMARTYQEWMEQGVEEKGCSANGKRAVKRSQEKLKWICTILAAERTEVVRCEYEFGLKGREPGSGRRRTVHFVPGTAGDYIPNPAWS